MTESSNGRGYEDVAVIGVSGRFPGAASCAEFWTNVQQGVESITFFSREQLRAAGVPETILNDPRYVPAKGYLEGWDQFDPAFFDYSQREAELMDPQIRILHECAWEALEDAGYAPYRAGDVGVFIGGSSNPYWFCAAQQRQASPSEQYHVVALNDNQSLSTRISYKLNLTGPSFTLQTACSSSLVALHAACRALIARECRMALAGGVSILFPPLAGYLHESGMVTSPDGYCRAFDANGQGTLAGDGCGLVVLKLLQAAIEDGDHIYAVVKGTAVNNDGRAKIGYTAPSVNGQAEVIRKAHQAAGVDPATIGYLEAHGTGTPLGDPIEIAALMEVFASARTNSCAIGSVKTNVGHLNHAAGIAGFIKTVMALRDHVLPPSLHFHTPNPQIDFARGPFYVNGVTRCWEGQSPLRAAVSSFGIGGTNAHAVLEEAPKNERTATNSDGAQLLVLTARTETALDNLSSKLSAYLESNTCVDMTDVAYTLQRRTSDFPIRRAIVCESRNEAVSRLNTKEERIEWTSSVVETRRTIAYLLPGQGSQYAGMGAGLYRSIRRFRSSVDACLDTLPDAKKGELQAAFQHPERRNAEEINDTRLAQPALFICEFACASLLKSLGIAPAVLLGHSLGELVAACLAGVFSLEDALRIVTLRAELMQSLPSGVMLSVDLHPDDATQLLQREVSLAAANGPRRCVLSGPSVVMRELEDHLTNERISFRRISTSHAFHSAMMDPVLEKFAKAVASCKLRDPEIPFLSNVSGKWIKPHEATDPEYWARQLRCTVQFSAGVDLLFGMRNPLAIECGPGNALSSLVRSHRSNPEKLVVTNLMGRDDQKGSDEAHLLAALGKLWLKGMDLNWLMLHEGKRQQRISLPTYFFTRRRLPSQIDAATKSNAEIVQFYLPTWRRRASRTGVEQRIFGTNWLVFADGGMADSAAEHIRSGGGRIVIVTPGERFRITGPARYEIGPSDPQDYQRLITTLETADYQPTHILHGWSLDQDCNRLSPISEFQSLQERGFLSVLYLTHAVTARRSGAALDFYVLCRDATNAPGTSAISPAQAPLIGLATVISQEAKGIRCRSIDVGSDDLGCGAQDALFHSVIDSLFDTDSVAAYRHGELWEPDYAPLHLPSVSDSTSVARERGVYLITGGLGRLGMLIGEYLFRTVGAKLVLTTPFEHSNGDDGGLQFDRNRRRQFLERLRAAGADVLTVVADCADKEQMSMAFKLAEARFGPVNGVIHTAAVTRSSSISKPVVQLTRYDCEEQFRAKVHGAIVLHELLQHRRVDFVLMMSSLSSVLGGLGLGAYASANAFLDAAAHAWSTESATRWLSVNWDGWELRDDENAVSRLLTIDAGLEATKRILANAGPAQVLVSATDLTERQRQWVSVNTDPVDTDQQQSFTRSAFEQGVKQELIRLFEAMFGTSPVRPEDSFSNLGGDSLIAIGLVSRINQAFSVRLQTSDLLEGQTISQLATQIENISRAASRPRLRRAEQREYYPLSFSQEGLLTPKNLVYETRFNCSGVFEIFAPLEADKLQAAFRTLISRHDIFRTGFDWEHRRQRVTPDVDFELPVLDCSAAETNQVFETFVRPFNTSEPPLLRAMLVKVGTESSHLLLDMHHAITDAVSLNLMMTELWSLYRGLPLDEVPLPYSDYAVWQHRMVHAGAFHDDEKFWHEALQDYDWTELPATEQSHPGPAFDKCVLDLPPKTTTGLVEFSRQRRITLMTLFMAAIYQAIRRIADQKDIAIGVRVSRRTEPLLETVLGPFVEDAVCRVNVPEHPTADRVLSKTEKALAAILDHPGYPYERLNQHWQSRAPTINGELFTILVNQLPAIAHHAGNAIKAQFSSLPRLVASKYYLNLRLRPGQTGQTWRVDAKYRSDKFSRTFMNQFLHSVLSAAQSLTEQI